MFYLWIIFHHVKHILYFILRQWCQRKTAARQETEIIIWNDEKTYSSEIWYQDNSQYSCYCKYIRNVNTYSKKNVSRLVNIYILEFEHNKIYCSRKNYLFYQNQRLSQLQQYLVMSVMMNPKKCLKKLECVWEILVEIHQHQLDQIHLARPSMVSVILGNLWRKR